MFRVSRGNYFCALRRCIMFWCPQCRRIHYLKINSSRRGEKTSAINFWWVTSRTSNSHKCLNVAWRIIVCNGACGQFPGVDTFQRSIGLELVSCVSPFPNKVCWCRWPLSELLCWGNASPHWRGKYSKSIYW